MTLKRSKITGNFVAQCDECFDFIDFDEDDPFPSLPYILSRTGWVATKARRDRWHHYCPDCRDKEIKP